MLLNKQRLLSLATVCGTLALCGVSAAQAETPSSAPGVVRITDRAQGVQQTSFNFRHVARGQLINGAAFHGRGQYSESGGCGNGNCGDGGCGIGGCDSCGKRSRWFRHCGFMKRLWDAHARHKRCKCGYFIPSGCGGGGCPWFGTYDVVYPVNPHHFDSRDGRLYSAQGYGVPMAVPLAPNVRHAYNYGWGIPSSRRTPISNPAGGGVQIINP